MCLGKSPSTRIANHYGMWDCVYSSRDRHFHAVLTNEKEMDGGRLLDWHREKAGTVEPTHDEVKNGLSGGHVPNQRFGVNSSWFNIALLTYNIVSAIKGLRSGRRE